MRRAFEQLDSPDLAALEDGFTSTDTSMEAHSEPNEQAFGTRTGRIARLVIQALHREGVVPTCDPVREVATEDGKPRQLVNLTGGWYALERLDGGLGRRLPAGNILTDAVQKQTTPRELDDPAILLVRRSWIAQLLRRRGISLADLPENT
jgi:hypothetical protein